MGLSPKFTQTVYAALSQVSDRIPMLLVEQNTVMALRHCTRAAVMVTGKLVLEGTAAELSDREALVASYLGEEPALTREEIAVHQRWRCLGAKEANGVIPDSAERPMSGRGDHRARGGRSGTVHALVGTPDSRYGPHVQWGVLP